MSQTGSRVVAILLVLVGALAVESLHAADAADELTNTSLLDIMGGVDSSTFDVGPDTKRISLSLNGEHLVFRRDSYQQIADGIIVWSGRDVQEEAATYLYVARNAEDVSIKLVKGDFEYDIFKDSSGDYELRATDLRNTVANEYLADSDQKVASGASQKVGTTSITTFAVAPPLEITVNLAYTKAARDQFPGATAFKRATALKNAFVIGLVRTNDSLKHSNLNVRVKLGRVVFVSQYTENRSLRLVRQDVEAGLVPGLPVPTSKNKTVLVVDVYGEVNGTAMLAGPYAVIKHHVISTLTLAHEIGHTFGAVHLKAYQFTNGRYTVMAPFDYGTLREPIYSNPKVQWFGEQAGTGTLFNAKRMCTEFFKLGPGCWIAPQ